METVVPIITTVITGLTAILVAYIGVAQRQYQLKNEKMEQLRQDAALTQLEMIQAVANLSLITARAIRGDNQNGDVESAEKWVTSVKIQMERQMREMSQMVR